MALFKQLSDEEILKNYSHVGVMFGIVPVYVDLRNKKMPVVAVRNGWPDGLLDFCQGFHCVFETTRSLFDPRYQPRFKILITGEIRKM